MEFEKRLERAIQRGENNRLREEQDKHKRKMNEEDLKNLHTSIRLELSEHIEACLRKLADYFPGFRYNSIFGEDGWGARIHRDDLDLVARGTHYSRFEMVIRPYSQGHLVELHAKGTIANKEILNRTHYQRLEQVDLDTFREMIDLWVLEYAEKYAAKQG